MKSCDNYEELFYFLASGFTVIVFDNEEYLQKKSEYDISSHKGYVRGVLKDNEELLREYQSMLEAFSGIADTKMTNLDEIKNMTAALNHVLKGENIEYVNANEGKKAVEIIETIYKNVEQIRRRIK